MWPINFLSLNSVPSLSFSQLDLIPSWRFPAPYPTVNRRLFPIHQPNSNTNSILFLTPNNNPNPCFWKSNPRSNIGEFNLSLKNHKFKLTYGNHRMNRTWFKIDSGRIEIQRRDSDALRCEINARKWRYYSGEILILLTSSSYILLFVWFSVDLVSCSCAYVVCLRAVRGKS